MKKYMYWISVIIGCLIFILCILCIKLLFSEKTITDPTKYLQVNSYTQNSLQEDCVGLLMDKKNYNPSNAKYYYHYPSVIYEPAFVIHLEYRFESSELLQQEITRIDSLAQEQHMNNNMILYSANSPARYIEHYLDDEIYDGLCYYFEFAYVDHSSMTISYLTAFVQDNQSKNMIVSKFIESWKSSKDSEVYETDDGSMS